MRVLAFVALMVCAIPSSSLADKPRVSRTMIKAMEVSIDNQLRGIWPDDPVEVIGVTQGTYITGQGLVFATELNVAPSAGITPFHPTRTKEETQHIHDKKFARMPKLRSAMQEMLMNSAASLDLVPADEQIALGITLFYWQGENTEGLPAQIVMHAPRRVLVSVKSGMSPRTALNTALKTEEF